MVLHAQTRRTERGDLDAMRQYKIRERQSAQHGGIRLAGGRRRLNAVAALRGSPKEAGEFLIKTCNEAAVGDEGSQTGPDMARPPYIERGRARRTHPYRQAD